MRHMNADQLILLAKRFAGIEAQEAEMTQSIASASTYA